MEKERKGLTASRGAAVFKQWSLPGRSPEGLHQGSPPKPWFQAPYRGVFPMGSRTIVLKIT